MYKDHQCLEWAQRSDYATRRSTSPLGASCLRRLVPLSRPSFIGRDVLREQTSAVIVSTDTDDLSMGWIGSIGDWVLVGLYAADISFRGFVVIRQMRSIIQGQSTSSWSDTSRRLRRLSKYRASDVIITINKRWRIQSWGMFRHNNSEKLPYFKSVFGLHNYQLKYKNS